MAHPAISKIETGFWQQNAPGETVCGDRYYAKTIGNILRVGIIDGLGHGLPAARAANAAWEIIENNNYAISELIPVIHDRLKSTRGAVLSIASINMTTLAIEYIGIGNISTYIVFPDQVRTLLNDDGFLGYTLPKYRVRISDFSKAQKLIMCSDGIKSIPRKKLLHFGNRSVRDIAKAVAETWYDNRDDGTVLVVQKKEY